MSLRRPTAACILFVYLSRRRSRHPISFQLFILFNKSWNNIVAVVWASFLFMTHSCIHWLYLLSELSCEYFQSTHLACWFGQMLMKAISWMKSLIASPTPRGDPVSLVRPWIWSLYYIRFRYQINSSSLSSTLDEMTDVESCISLPAVFFHHQPILESVVCLHTTVFCPPLCMIIGVLVIIWLSNRSSTL